MANKSINHNNSNKNNQMVPNLKVVSRNRIKPQLQTTNYPVKVHYLIRKWLNKIEEESKY